MYIRLTGTMPLIMHNIQMADDQIEIVREIKKLTSKRTKTDEDKLEIDRLSFAGSLYYDKDLGPYLPADHLFRSLMEAGKITRAGKNVERALSIHTYKAKLLYDGPRDPDALWGVGADSKYVSRLMVNVQGSRIPRVRPIFPEWQCVFEIDVDDRVLSLEDFDDIATKAGKMIGVGTYRRFYGRYGVEIAR